MAAGFNLLDHPIKIALKQPVLHDAVFFEFTFSVRLGDFCRYLACVLQHLPVPQFQEAAKAPDPQIYIQALNEAGILPHETLFIDDMEVNTEAAKSIGMQVLNIEPGSLMEVLPNYLKELKR